MHRSSIAVALVLLGAAAPALAQEQTQIELAECVSFPHAGIALAVPKGFEFLQVSEPVSVMRAVRMLQGAPVQAVSLAAHLLDDKTTAEQFAASMIDDLRANLAVRHLEVRKETPMEVAGLPGTARLLSYTFRAEPTLAAGVVFVRELESPRARICYVLNVECSDKHSAKLLPILGKVIGSVSLVPVRRPAEVPIERLGEPIRNSAGGYSLRPPARWFAVKTASGLATAQMDYLRGGLIMPRALVAVQSVGAELTSEACDKRWLEQALQNARDSSLDVKTLSEGPATMAGREAHQFMLLQLPAPAASSAPATAPSSSPAAEDEPMIIAQRTLCADAPDGGRKSFALVLIVPGRDAEAAAKMLDKVCEGFALLEAAPAPASGPAEEKK